MIYKGCSDILKERIIPHKKVKMEAACQYLRKFYIKSHYIWEILSEEGILLHKGLSFFFGYKYKGKESKNTKHKN